MENKSQVCGSVLTEPSRLCVPTIKILKICRYVCGLQRFLDQQRFKNPLVCNGHNSENISSLRAAAAHAVIHLSARDERSDLSHLACCSNRAWMHALQIVSL